MYRLSIVSTLNHEIWVDLATFVTLNGEILRTNEVTVPPQDVGIAVETEGYSALVFVVSFIFYVIEQGIANLVSVVMHHPTRGADFKRRRYTKTTSLTLQIEEEPA